MLDGIGKIRKEEKREETKRRINTQITRIHACQKGKNMKTQQTGRFESSSTRMTAMCKYIHVVKDNFAKVRNVADTVDDDDDDKRVSKKHYKKSIILEEKSKKRYELNDTIISSSVLALVFLVFARCSDYKCK